MYLSNSETRKFLQLLKTFFALPYSTDLDGKDAEYILRQVKSIEGRPSRRKELFDLIDGELGYSVKTLRKRPQASRVDLQEQRFCDVDEIRRMLAEGSDNSKAQGRLLLTYMRTRILNQMQERGIRVARSAILLKWWDKERNNFSFRYWEEDFLGYLDQLWARNENGEIDWIIQPKGIHARDSKRQDAKGKSIRLLRMHYKHNQIFTDHDIPGDAILMSFTVRRIELSHLAKLLKL